MQGGDIQTISYVFNGDWVDRGPHQLETVRATSTLSNGPPPRAQLPLIPTGPSLAFSPAPLPTRADTFAPAHTSRSQVLLLFSLKAMYPSHITLVRGNHEFRSQSEGMGEAGFRAAVERLFPTPKLAEKAYEAVHAAFEWLPLAALISESVLVLHGGVGDGSWSLGDLAAVPRPLQEAHEHVCTMHALWSDPSDSDAAMRSGVHPSQRGEHIPEFGMDVTEAFCDANKVDLVIRSHQFCRQGYKVMHGGRLITLFSARNYFEGSYGKANDGAMLLLAPDNNGHLRIHPKRLEHLDMRSYMRHQAPAASDWRVRLLGSLAKCLAV